MKQPTTKKHLVIAAAFGLFSISTFIILMTGFFSESPFQARYLAFWISIAVSMLSMAGIYSNYKKNKKPLSGTG